VYGVGGAHPDADADDDDESPWHRTTTDAGLGRARNPTLAEPRTGAKDGGGLARELCIVARGRIEAVKP
jgi:hypothetical protein